MKERKLAIFEFDNTLIKGESYSMFLRYLSENAILHMVNCAVGLPWVLASNLHLGAKDAGMERMLTLCMGKKPKKKIEEQCRAFVDKLNKCVRGVALQKLQALRIEGYRIVIVDSTLAAIVRPWALQYGIEDVVATELEYNSKDVFTGRFATDKGGVKERLKALIPEIDECDVVAYGSRESGDALAEIVGEYNTL